MAESLNVVALISGGKDSLFSILHCIQNGHKVVALGNLYPSPPPPDASPRHGTAFVDVDGDDEEHDLNSFMFQTVGHTAIPLYEQALGIPLYRQQILGTAVQTGTSYSHADVQPLDSPELKDRIEENSSQEVKDETESLIPLLKRIMAKHPTANALSTGAILSTYQRTRIESVALRLGLTPLAYLWKYPILPPGIQSSLLEDMQDVGLDARIIKVASGGLDESFLWGNIASSPTIRRVEKSMRRFGMDGDGGVLGEGGEFETLVVDGPANLFKGKIVIKSEDQKVIIEGGGSAWLQLRSAQLVMKPLTTTVQSTCRTPDLLEKKFQEVLGQLEGDMRAFEVPVVRQSKPSNSLFDVLSSKKNVTDSRDDTEYWSISAATKDDRPINLEAHEVVAEIRHRLQTSQLVPSDIISTVIILRSMEHFANINKVYGALFVEPNPPSRVTISCGSMLPRGINMTIHLKVHNPFSLPKKSLHVQSRSYWAPANIGPYSQAVSTPIFMPSISSQSSSTYETSQTWAVNVAGQIPLIPHTMLLPTTLKDADSFENFQLQAVLSLQHLWRIGHETNVSWWTSCVAYLPQQSTATHLTKKVSLLSQAWNHLHMSPRSPTASCENSDAEEERDLWEEKYYAALQNRGGTKLENFLPCWDIVKADGSGRRDATPPFFVAEVEELPRQSAVEWHAHLGIANASSIEVLRTGYCREKEAEQEQEGSAVFRTIVNDMMTHYVIMIPYSICSGDRGLDLAKVLGEALKDSSVGVGYEYTSFASYIDVGLTLKPEFGKAERILNAVGVVPCRTLWDGEGKRLAAVVLL